MRILDDITGAIGHTPLVRLPRLGAGLAAVLVVKHEALNPGGSLKDRIALNMVDDALARGELRPGMVVVEPTSGNTGIGLAQAAVVRGLGCVVVMPESASVERQRASVGDRLRGGQRGGQGDRQEGGDASHVLVVQHAVGDRETRQLEQEAAGGAGEGPR